MLFVVKINIAADPVDITTLSYQRIMAATHHFACSFQQFWLLCMFHIHLSRKTAKSFLRFEEFFGLKILRAVN